jgi:predicted CxxxxCH...CXXCH cytochrome family protein
MRRTLLILSLTAAAGSGCFVPRDEDKTQTDTRCTSCHGSASNPGDLLQQSAPPTDTHGETDAGVPGVGAHQRHLLASATHGSVACTECHVVPTLVTDKGHNDHPGPATLTWGPLASQGGLAPKYNQVTYGCANTYCHGSASVDWTKQRTPDEACGTCHGLPPPAPHPQTTQCFLCHGAVVDAQNQIINADLHVNGKVDVAIGGCNVCHGSATNAAPPRSLDGGTLSSQLGVGAHQAHLSSSPLHRDVQCADCHLVPTSAGSPGHLDGVVEVRFDGTIAAQGPRDGGATFNATAQTCNTWCHAPNGPTDASPAWTRQGAALGCTSCHGLPPPAPHPQVSRCELCHANAQADGGFVDKNLHVNGVVDVKALQCNTCHGSAANAAPPVDTNGNTATTLPSVGAHQQHLKPTFARPVRCEECHTVPAAFDSPGHLDGTVQVNFSGVATAGGSTATWSSATNTCASYCHNPKVIQGGTDIGAQNPTPLWTKVDGSQVSCTSCHGVPPPAPHPFRADCFTCHQDIDSNFNFVRPELHVDGQLTFGL